MLRLEFSSRRRFILWGDNIAITRVLFVDGDFVVDGMYDRGGEPFRGVWAGAGVTSIWTWRRAAQRRLHAN